MRAAVISLLVLFASLPLARTPAAEVPARIPRPDDAVAAAVSDLLTLNKDDQPFQRYLWLPQPTKEQAGVVSYVLNACVSRSQHIRRPVALHDGALLRFDLRGYTYENQEIEALRDIWEDLALVNFYFHTIREVTKTELVPSASYVHANGQTYTQKWVSRKIKTAEPSIHAGPKLLLLCDLAGSRNPIMRADQFVVFATTTLEGGLYYKLRGISASNNPRQTDYEKYLAGRNINLEALEAKNLIERSAQFRSGVTGKPRAIEFFQGSGRVSANSGLVISTLDTADEDTDPGADPIRNLIKFRFAAREVLAELPNGLIEYTLFDAEGKLQDVVPDNIAHDHTIPAPHTSRLQPGISCMRCHGPSDGWLPFRADARTLLAGLLKAYDDEQADPDILKAYHELYAKYGDDPENALRIARNQHSLATFKATGMDFRKTVSSLSNMFSRYRYDIVSPSVACNDLGYQLEDGTEQDYAELLNQLIPPLPANRLGVSPEDSILAAIRVWKNDRPLTQMPVNRFQWEQIFSDVMLRAITSETLPGSEINQLMQTPGTENLSKEADG